MHAARTYALCREERLSNTFGLGSNNGGSVIAVIGVFSSAADRVRILQPITHR